MSYKLGLPYQLSVAFYFNQMIEHYEQLNNRATTPQQFKFINERLQHLHHSLLQLSN
jgi:cell shape-determining protein MreC